MMHRPLLAAAALATATTFPAAAVTLPYFNNFDAEIEIPSDFVFDDASEWSLTGSGDKSLTNTLAGTSTAADIGIAALAVPELSGGSNVSFSLSANITLDAITNNGNNRPTFGFVVLGTSNTYASGYLVDTSADPGDGLFRIHKLGSGGGLLESSLNGSLTPGNEYTFTITGTYVDGDDADTVVDDLMLEFTLSGSGVTGGSLTISTIDDNPLDGQYFGLRNRSGANTNLTVSVDDFSLTVVPEPGSVTLLGLATGLIAFGRRRS